MKNYGRRRCSFVSARKPIKQSAGVACPYAANEGGRITEECVAIVTTRMEASRRWPRHRTQTGSESYMKDPVLEVGDCKWQSANVWRYIVSPWADIVQYAVTYWTISAHGKCWETQLLCEMGAWRQKVISDEVLCRLLFLPLRPLLIWKLVSAA
jgi:hypothetical protein